MIESDFEWHEAKAEANWQVHRLSFEQATIVFDDAFAIEGVDNRED